MEQRSGDLAQRGMNRSEQSETKCNSNSINNLQVSDAVSNPQSISNLSSKLDRGSNFRLKSGCRTNMNMGQHPQSSQQEKKQHPQSGMSQDGQTGSCDIVAATATALSTASCADEASNSTNINMNNCIRSRARSSNNQNYADADEGNSDNSGTSNRSSNISIGNNSFGFNFDSDEMIQIGGVSVAGIESSSEAGLSLSGGGIHPKKRSRRSSSCGERVSGMGETFSRSGSPSGSLMPKKRKKGTKILNPNSSSVLGDQSPRSSSSLSNSNSSGEGEKGEDGSSDSSADNNINTINCASGRNKTKGNGERRKKLPRQESSALTNCSNKCSNDGGTSDGSKNVKMRANGNDQSTVSSLTSGNSQSGTLASTQTGALVTECSGSRPQEQLQDEQRDSNVGGVHMQGLQRDQLKQNQHKRQGGEAPAPSGDNKGTSGNKNDRDADNNSDGGYNTDDEGMMRQKTMSRSAVPSHSHLKSVNVMDMSQRSECGVSCETSVVPGYRESKNSRARSTLLKPQANSESNTKVIAPAHKRKSTHDDYYHDDKANEDQGGGDRPLSDAKREERNAREKDRSFRISQQIEDLRALLSQGGVIVPKGTKSSILTEAANYIRMLQQTQVQTEHDRSQLIQQMQMIGSGALGPQAAKAMRHAAAQNGVWALGNFGGAPPPMIVSAPPPMTVQEIQTVTPVQAQHIPSMEMSEQVHHQPPPTDVRQISKVQDEDYKRIFYSSSVAMAVASMGGAIVDANDLFCRLSGYSREELRAMTIFNLTARTDLYHAFDRISAMIEGEAVKEESSEAGASEPITLQGSVKNGVQDWGLSISLIKSEKDRILKCFCVTLLKGVPPVGTRWPVLATMGCQRNTATQRSYQVQFQKLQAQAQADAKFQYEEHLQDEADQYAGISQMLDDAESMVKMNPPQSQTGMAYTTG